MPMMEFVGLKGVVPNGLIYGNDDSLVISEDTELTVNGNFHIQNHYKLEITKFMIILLLNMFLR